MTRRDLFKRLLIAPLAAAILQRIPLPPRVRGWVFRVSDSPTFSFGFSGFKPSTSSQVRGQVLFTGRLVLPASPIRHGVLVTKDQVYWLE